MNWLIVTVVFHVLRLNLCVALSQVCSDHQFLSAGVCVNCTVCKQPGKNVVLRPCSSHEDTICGSVSDVHINLAGIEFKDDVTNPYFTVDTENNLSKKNIAGTLKELSQPLKPIPAAVESLNTTYYDDEDENEDDLDYEYEDDSTSTSVTKSNEATFKVYTKEQSRKEFHVDEWDSKSYKGFKDTDFSHFPDTARISVPNLDTLVKKIKSVKKFKLKETNTNVEINDHLLKIADTQFKVGDEKSDNGRRLELAHPRIVDEKIFVDSMEKNRKASTFFSSGEKQIDREYINEMGKLFNETSSLLDENNSTTETTTLNSTKQNSSKANVDDYDFDLLKNMLDRDNEDDDDDDDDDEDEDDEDEDEDDEDDDEDSVSDDDDPLFNNFGSSNSSDRNDSAETSDYDTDDDINDYISGNEKTDFDKEDDTDLQENDFYEDKTYIHLPGLTSNDVVAEPFVSTANWQILILVAAMSACLLFFVVVSAYICIYMRKRTYYKTTFVPDIEDLSSRVNLIQHAALEVNDSSNMRNYTSHLRSVKSNNEKLPKVYSRSE